MPTASVDTNPSLGLKLQNFLFMTGLFGLILGVSIGGILCNLGGSRIYVLALYASVRCLTPGGRWGSEKTPSGGAWRWFTEDLFFTAAAMRRYLGLGFADLPDEFVAAEAEPGAQFVLAAFPHGCASDFRILMDGMLREVCPNLIERNAVRTLAASVLFRIPVVREMTLWTGGIDARRSVAEAALADRKSLLVLPGGEAEQLLTIYGKERVYLSKRKGFIKLAMRKGVPVVPIYVFGSSDAYYTYDQPSPSNNETNKRFDWTFYGFRHKLMKNLGICIPLYSGLWGFPHCPLPKKTTIVFGKPIRFAPSTKTRASKKTQSDSSASTGFEPTAEELDEGHALFVKELTALFDAHKTALGYGDRTLEVV